MVYSRRQNRNERARALSTAVLESLESRVLLAGTGLPTVAIHTTQILWENSPHAGYVAFVRSGASTTDALTINFNIGGTAINGTDYDTIPSSVTIPARSPSTTLQITPKDNGLAEGTKNIELTLDTSGGTYTTTQTPANLYILDDEMQLVTVSALQPEAKEAGLTDGVFQLTRTTRMNASISDPLTVHFTLSGTAVEGTDFATIDKSVTFEAGSSKAYVNVTPIGDKQTQGLQTVVLTIDDGGSAFATNPVTDSATMYVVDDEMPLVSVTAATPVANEADDKPGKFLITRAGPLKKALTVAFTLSGTAEADAQYKAVPLTVTIPKGKASAYVNIAPLVNPAADGTTDVSLALADGSTYMIDPENNGATVSIFDAETTYVSIAPKVSNAYEKGLKEGQFLITRGGDLSSEMTITVSDLSSIDGTAEADIDYQALPTEVTFAKDQSQAVVNVKPIDDGLYKGRRTVALGIDGSSLPDGYVLDPSSTEATVNIIDDELPAVSVKATDSSAAETVVGDPKNPGLFKISRDGLLADPLTVNLKMGGTARGGSNYEKLRTTVTFAAGQSYVLVPLNVKDDSVVNATRTAIMTTKGSKAYKVDTSASAATVNIADNEPTITIAATDATAAEVGAGAPANPGVVRISRTGSTTGSIVVTLAYKGSAKRGAKGDYTLSVLPAAGSGGSPTALTGTKVTIAAGQSFVDIQLDVLPDSKKESNETAVLRLAGSKSYKLDSAASTATVTIQDSAT